MIRKYHIDLTAMALALAAALEAAVEVVGGQDLTWNVIALDRAFAVTTFVNTYERDQAGDDNTTEVTEPTDDASA